MSRQRVAERWTEADAGDQSGRVAVVTGGNSGIGFETARMLAACGMTVVLACRDLAKADQAAAQIAAGAPSASPGPSPGPGSGEQGSRERGSRARWRPCGWTWLRWRRCGRPPWN